MVLLESWPNRRCRRRFAIIIEIIEMENPEISRALHGMCDTNLYTHTHTPTFAGLPAWLPSSSTSTLPRQKAVTTGTRSMIWCSFYFMKRAIVVVRTFARSISGFGQAADGNRCKPGIYIPWMFYECMRSWYALTLRWCLSSPNLRLSTTPFAFYILYVHSYHTCASGQGPSAKWIEAKLASVEWIVHWTWMCLRWEVVRGWCEPIIVVVVVVPPAVIYRCSFQPITPPPDVRETPIKIIIADKCALMCGYVCVGGFLYRVERQLVICVVHSTVRLVLCRIKEAMTSDVNLLRKVLPI